ncbi:MAG: hypothetical protein EOP07_25605, partial [Proteobacteria bacterium]
MRSVLVFILLVVAFPEMSAADCSSSQGDYESVAEQSTCLEGQKLFYNKSLSIDGQASCASCHVKDLHYGDGRRRPHLRGEDLALSRTLSLKDISRRSAPYFWNGRAESLEGAIYWPLYQTREIGASPEHLDQRGGGVKITRALTSYIKTLNSGEAPVDAYARGDCSSLSNEALEGLKIFQAADCQSCHEGSEFAGIEVKPYLYENLPDAYFKIEEARYGQDWELHASAKGKSVTLEVKAPSLRNLPASGPFGQFGQSRDLNEYIALHSRKVSTHRTLSKSAQKNLVIFL